jgi:hypothetical protein
MATIALQLLAHQDPPTWWSDTLNLLPGYLSAPDQAVRQAAEEAIVVGDAYITRAN